MAIIVTATEEDYSFETLHTNIKVFLAGGISNCPNWQQEIINQLIDIKGVTIYNPRREVYPADDPEAVVQQIGWEYKHLQEVDLLIFWFSRGSLNPITLYELGRWAHSTERQLVMGIDPDYPRKQDVVIQTALSRPEVVVQETFEDFVREIKKQINNMLATPLHLRLKKI